MVSIVTVSVLIVAAVAAALVVAPALLLRFVNGRSTAEHERERGSARPTLGSPVAQLPRVVRG